MDRWLELGLVPWLICGLFSWGWFNFLIRIRHRRPSPRWFEVLVFVLMLMHICGGLLSLVAMLLLRTLLPYGRDWGWRFW